MNFKEFLFGRMSSVSCEIRAIGRHFHIKKGRGCKGKGNLDLYGKFFLEFKFSGNFG
jgi:hypothetical protein